MIIKLIHPALTLPASKLDLGNLLVYTQAVPIIGENSVDGLGYYVEDKAHAYEIRTNIDEATRYNRWVADCYKLAKDAADGVFLYSGRAYAFDIADLNTRNYCISYVAEEMMVRTEALYNGENKELEFMVPAAESPRFRTMFFEQRRRYAEVNFGTFIFNPLTAKVC